VALEVLLLLLIAPVGANALVWMVESQVPPAGSCAVPTPTTIVLLDGGTDRPPRATDDYAALSTSSLRRLWAAVSLWQRIPRARLVITGGGSGVPHSVLLRGLAERMGVPANAIEIETRSRTTWENALYTSELESPVSKRIWLVSSALHLPRAIGAFRAWGFEPCAWPSDSLYIPFSASLGYFMPQSSSLAKADQAVHELIGGLVYRGLEWKKRRQEAGGHAGSR
jgi:uncharacterized SAM-binding protein YcdF (DUF218 family)